MPEKDEPTFVFQINADVTDSAGETRSADRAIRVGYTALEAMISADDWQTDGKPVELKLETKTLDGEPQVAEGSVKIYELQAPDQVHRPPLAGLRAVALRRESGGGDAGEGEPGKDLSNPNNWPLGKVVAEKGFTTDTNGVAKLSFKLAAGAYRAVLETQDRFGKKVTGKLPLQVLQPEATKLAIKIPQLLAAPDWELQPGQEFMALWGTGYDTGRAFVEIEHRHQMVQRYWTKAGPNPAADQAGGDRGDARRLLRPRDLRPREPRLPRIAQGQCALEEQGPGAEMGALRLQAPARARRRRGR